MAQRLEGARSLCVVFQQESVHRQAAEHPLRDGFVATLGVPLALVVSTTDVQGDRDTLPSQPVEAEGISLHCLSEGSVRVLTQPAQVLTPSGVHIVAVPGRVNLDVGHAFVHQGGELRLDDARDVPQQF